MTNVKIRIEVNPNAETENLGDIQNTVDNIPSAENVSNVSVKITGDGLFQDIPSKSGGINGLSLANDLVFDENGLLDNQNLNGAVLESTESPAEFIWGVVPDNGEYRVRLVFTDAKSLKDIIIYGDSVVNQFPTQAIIDGSQVIYNDDLEWAINLGDESETHTIEFTNWNLTGYNACISKISVMLKYLEIDKHNGLKDVESTSQSSSDTTGLYYGTIENYGSIEIVDTNGELTEMIRDGVIDNSNTNLEILTNNQVIQTHISTDSSYDINTKVLSLDLGNKINSLDTLKYKGYNYQEKSEKLSTILFDVMSNLKYLLGTDNLTQEEFELMLSSKYDDSKTLFEYLDSIYVEYPIIDSNKTYREVIDEFCVIAQMQMFIEDSGKIKFVSARPRVFDEDFKPIHIPKSKMFSQLDYNLILKNKYDGVEISRLKPIKNYEFGVDVFKESLELSENLSDYEKESASNYKSEYYDTAAISSSIMLCDYSLKSGSIYVPKKSNQNLTKMLNYSTLLNSEDTENKSYTYSLKYRQRKGEASAKFNVSIYKSDDYADQYSLVEISGTANEETNKSFDGQINADQYEYKYQLNSNVEYSATSSLKKPFIRESMEIRDEDENGFWVDYKFVVGRKVYKLGGIILLPGGSQYNGVLNTTGEIIEDYPVELEIFLRGDQYTIDFKEETYQTENFVNSKTPISLSTGKLLQTDKMVEKVKNNILKDYFNGISTGSVTISCSDYFNSNGEKVINWTNGDVLKVGDIVYFDNDIYPDKSQRYWRIKGRTFRKTGVPMVDLELEEIKPKKELERYTWQEISKLSELDARSELSLGDTKQFTLTDGTILTATIIDFNKDKTSNNKYSGITFAVENLTQTSAIGTYSTGGVLWSNSIIRNEFLPNIYNKLPSDLQKYIKPVIKVTYAGKNTEQTEDALWLFGRKEIYYPSELNEGNTYEYFKDSDNIKNVFKYSDSTMQYWLRTVTNESNNNYNNYVEIGEQKLPPPLKPIPIINFDTTLSSTNKYNIVFGFCI